MKPLAIMIADDIAEIQSLVAQWLRTRGHHVACVSTGDAAIKLLDREHFDLVIADVLMPEGDGLDVIRELKQKQGAPRILAISGGGKYMQANDCVKMAEGLGADAAILKPFDETQLLSGIDRAFSAERRLG
jgi:two-component system phosphate regulon response regulator OmpR